MNQLERSKIMKKYNGRRSGIALFFTICTILVISIIAYGMIYFMRGEVHHTESYINNTVALLLAEAGVEETLFTVKSQMNNPENPFYQLITKQSEGSVDIDLSRLSEGSENVSPIVEKASAKARLTWQLDHKAVEELVAQGVPREIARQGTITINSQGNFHRSSKQIEVKKSLKAMLIKGPLNANAVGMVAPEHGLFLNAANPQSFTIEPFDFWDPWGFFVVGGKTYMKEGVKIDLPKWLMLTRMRSELDNPWLDMGIGWTGWNGGGDFSQTDIEYTDEVVRRQYNKWQGIFRWPWWKKVAEPYHSRTKKVEEYDNKKVNLYSADVYKRLANRVVDPKETPAHGKYFTNVNFREAFGRNQVTYNEVVPLYGWGDWRKVPNKYSRYFGNPTKAHDTSRAVEINGLTYIKGDVFLEGWVKGKGLLVVEGNIYVGGDVLTLPDDSGLESCVGIIALRDKSWDTSRENPQTGKIIYKPHHDSDWSRLGITHPFRNLSPRLEGSFHAEGGLELDTDSSMKKLCNMDIVGNLSVDYFDRRKMPNDVRITYFNWQEVLERSTYDYTVDKKIDYTNLYELAIQKEILSWREVDATL
jgi:hypothetical protein